jgi:ATP:corrinoid adenosyltransferase
VYVYIQRGALTVASARQRVCVRELNLPVNVGNVESDRSLAALYRRQRHEDIILRGATGRGTHTKGGHDGQSLIGLVQSRIYQAAI